MFITDQHRQKIRRYFEEMDRYLEVLERVAQVTPEEFLSDHIWQTAGERALHMALECATDVGNLIIDALVMRDPSSYEDIIQVLAEEQVFSKEFAESFMEAVRYRRILVHDYLERDAVQLFTMITAHKDDFSAFQKQIADYIKLGSHA